MTDSDRSERFIFIGGSPRSGTTLVQNMLDSHPDICGGPEFLHVPDIIKLRSMLHDSISREWIDLICSFDDVDRGISSLIENLLLPLADRQNKSFLSEKTPENSLVFSELAELFLRAHFIHVVRDPRAIISSMQQIRGKAIKKGLAPPAYTASIKTSINHVKKCMDAGFAASRRFPDRVLTVVYERLVTDPEAETKRICSFLGIEWDSQMLSPGARKHLGEKAITAKSDEIWYDAKKYNRNPDTSDMEKWRKELSSAHQVSISLAFRERAELRDLGYDLSLNSLAPSGQGPGLDHRLAVFSHALYCSGVAVAKRIPGVIWLKRQLMKI